MISLARPLSSCPDAKTSTNVEVNREEGACCGPGAVRAFAVVRVRLTEATDARTSLSRRVFERIVRILYAQKKVFAVMIVEWPAGRVCLLGWDTCGRGGAGEA